MYLNQNSPVAVASPGVVTISHADPAVIGKVAHGLLANTPLTFTTTGHLPAGLALATVYYVCAGATLLANFFAVSTAPGGTPLATTTDGDGNHSAVATDVVAVINVASAKVLGFEVKNTGANALDLFDVYGKFTETGNEVKLSTNAGDYTTPTYPILKASASPVTLAGGATAWFFMDVTGLCEVTLKASSAVGATTLELHGVAKFTV